jgi:RHS repeat-associated protein
MIKFLQVLRPVAAVVLFFVCWQFFMVSEFLAWAKEPPKTQFGERNPSEIGKFSRNLEELEGLIGKVHQGLDSGKDVSTQHSRIVAIADELDALNIGIEEEFAATGRKLDEIGAVPVIHERQRKALAEYREKFQEMKRLLSLLEKNKTRSAELKKDSEDLKAFLKANKPKSGHIPLDPNNLPHRAAKAKKILPRQTREEYEKDERFKPQKQHGWNQALPKDGIQIASTGDLSGLFSVAQAAPTGGITTPAPEDLAPTIDVQLTDPIRAKAAELGNQPLPIYQWVRNNIEYVPTYGSIQGADYCLQTKQCNSFDTSSLLIALLRASGIRSRYVYGTIEVPSDLSMNWVGVTKPELAVEVLNMGGIPAVGVVEGSQITKIRVEHVWVEAWIDYVPSRGAVHHAGDNWIPMDASWKQDANADGIDLGAAVPFDANGFLAGVAAGVSVNETEGSATGLDCGTVGTARASYENAVRSFLNTQHPGATVADLVGGRSVITELLPIFPSVLAVKVVATAARLSTLPDNLRHSLRISLRRGTTTVLDLLQALPKVAGARITLGYVPAGPEDFAVISNYLPQGTAPADLADLPSLLPAYLIEVRPELRIDGAVVASGPAIGLGNPEDLTVTFTGPGAEKDVASRVIHAGEYSGLALDLGRIALGGLASLRARLTSTADRAANGDLAGLTREELLGDQLVAAGTAYFAELDRLAKVRSGMEGMLSLRLPSAALTRSTISTQEAFGVVLQAGAGGLALDELRGAGILVSRNGARGREAGFALSTALDASAFSHLVSEQLFSTVDEPAIGMSAVRVIAEAMGAGVPIHLITAGNAASALPLLQLDQELKDAIEAAAHAGKNVLVPRSAITLSGWTGGACLIVDPATGDSASLLPGGITGAALAGPAWAGKAIALNLVGAADPALGSLYRGSASEGQAAGFASVVAGISDLDDGLATASLDLLLSGTLSGALAEGMGCLLDSVSAPVGLASCLAAALGEACLARDRALIASTNSVPIAAAGADQQVKVGTYATLDGTGSADQDLDPLHYRWSFVTRPAGSAAVLSDATAVRPSFVADKVGSYELELVVQDGRVYGAPDRTVIVAEADLVTVPSVAGMSLAEAETALASAGLNLDGVEQQVHATVPAWSVISQSPVAAVSAERGSLVDLVVSTGPAVDTQKPTLSVTLNRPTPVYPAGTPVLATITAEDDSGNVNVTMSLDGVVTPSSLPETLIATTGMAPGSRHTILVTAADLAGNSVSQEVFFGILDPTDVTEPQVAIASPVENAEVTAPVSVIGTVSDAALVRWQLSYALVGESGESILAQGTAPAANGALGMLDPTLMKNGLYALRLAATDAGGRELFTESVVRVIGEMKVGNFTVSFTDLEIPVAGIPVRVVRTYDSRDKGKGDFGVGWRVDFKSVTTQENMIPGRGWYQEPDDDPYMPTWCIKGEHYVTVTLPDGKSEEFDAVPQPQCNLFLPIEEVTVAYAARPGTTSTLSAGNPGPFYYMNGTFLDYDGAEVFDPGGYTLTALDGTVYEVDQTFGIKKVIDPNGNTVTYGESGIVHSAGKSISFVRDAEGRITQVVDPDGGQIVYGYDTRGDLVSVTDRGGNVTRMGYDLRHDLGRIQDPRGITPLRNEYDDQGRLVAHVDAHGKRIEYTHDVAGRQEIVTDRLGRQSLYVYDDWGRVLHKTDPDGRTTGYTYDALGNKASETDPLGNVSRWVYDEKRNLLSETKVIDGVEVTTRNTYDHKGRLETTTDPMGHVTVNHYDTRGNLLTTTDAMGKVTTNTYDAQGNVASTTDPLGHTTWYGYDLAGNLLYQTDAAGNVTRYSYGSHGKETETDPSGGVTRYEYDTAGRQVAVTDALGQVTRTEYDAAGTRIAEIDALGVRTSFVYDAAGRLISTKHPDGTSTATRFDAEGNRVASVDQLGRETRYEYDENKRLVRTIHPDGATQQYGYDAAGRQTTVTGAAGDVTTKVYDALGRVSTSIDPEGHTTSFTYDLNGTQLTQTDANGHTTTFAHDAAGRVTTTTLPGGETSTVGYDALGRKIAETDAAGILTQFGYDARGNLTSVTDALGGVTRYEYDAGGNRTAIVDARGNRTSFVYDALNRLVSKTMPSGSTETYDYDTVGRQRTKTKPDGSVIQYGYDAQGRLLNRDYPDGSGARFAYAAMGKRTAATDRRGVTSYAYDVRDRLLTQMYPDGQSVGYTYDPNGQITSVSSTAGTIQYRYTASGRLHEVEDPQGRVTQYGYDNAGNRTGLSYPNGTAVAYGYDTNNRLRTLEHKNSVASVIASYAYTLGATGNRTRIDEHTGISRAYQYDNLYRLTQDAVTDPAGAQAYTDDYSYDAVGNRLTKTHAAGAVPGVPAEYAYNSADQLVEENGVTYTYDLNGNLKTKADASGTTTYTWDYEDRLVKVSGPGGTVSYEYDVDGNRVSSTTAAGTTRYLVDTNRALPQVLAEYTPAGTLTASYVYADDLISMTRGSETHWYHFDGLGSTRLLTDEVGAVTDTYSYDAFGNLIERTGTTQNDFLFTGQQRDANAGFYYLRARYYAPTNGRFVSSDVFAGDPLTPPSLHRYLYADSSPTNKIDPTGAYSMQEVDTISVVSAVLASLPLNLYLGYCLLTIAKESTIKTGIQELYQSHSDLFSCDETARSIGRYLKDNNREEGKDWNVIEYQTNYGQASESIWAAKHFGRFRGEEISRGGIHFGVIYRTKGNAVGGYVTDNNAFWEPRSRWVTGYEVRPLRPNSRTLEIVSGLDGKISIYQADLFHIGKIREIGYDELLKY